MIKGTQTIPALRRRWDQLLQQSQIPAARGEQAFDALCAAYQEKQRHYHTLMHIKHMLALVSESGNTQSEAGWATWYHDYVYRPGRSDNEQRSAAIARDTLAGLQVPQSVIDRTCDIILATRSHRFAGTDPVLQGVLDADMAILGTPPARYGEYCDEVRREFGLTPRLLFNRGRRHFIAEVLSQSRIFATDWFYERFEAQARSNLQAELTQL